jgi:hypothetical protein
VPGEVDPPVSESESTAEDSPRVDTNILDYFVSSLPSAQNSLDIFEGEWSSRLPGAFGDLKAGTVPLFEDDRLAWGLDIIGDITGKTALELGPLEGGHSYMLSQAGASVLGIEAQTRGFLKCLIAKEILNMRNVQFMLGDVMAYLRSDPGHFDVAVASGILYHMASPVEMLDLLTKVSDHLFLWTHVWDAEIMDNEPLLGDRYAPGETTDYKGFTHTLHRFQYNDRDLSNLAFCGGGQNHSQWLERADLLRAIEFFGWQVDAIGIDNLHHVSGPEISLVASPKH